MRKNMRCKQFLLRFQQASTRNSSGDEIANVNFLYDDIVHALQNTIDWCINSATDRRGYVLERIYQIQWNNAMQRPLRLSRSFKVNDFGTNRKPTYDFLLVINSNLPPILHLSKLWLIIGQIFASEREVPLRLGLLRRSRWSKVTEFGINRKLICDFLLVISTNLARILHRIRDIAFDRPKIALFSYPSCV